MAKTALLAAVRDQLQNREPHVSHVEFPHAYASEAQKCSRQIAYRVAGVPEESEFATTSLIAWTIGNHLHEVVQRALKEMHPDFEDEVRWSMDGLTGRADGLYIDPEKGKVLVEIKTMAPRYYASAVRGNVPQSEHMLQADISALALEADYVHIIYIQKVKEGDFEPIHEWFYRADLAGAREEVAKLQKIVADYEAGLLAEREYLGEVLDPEEKGKKWPCGYCPFQQRCIADGPGLIPLPTADTLRPEVEAVIETLTEKPPKPSLFAQMIDGATSGGGKG